MPLSNTLAVRVAANIDRRDSFLIDGNANDGVEFDPFKDNKAFRVSALFKPSDTFSALVIGDYSAIQGLPTNSVSSANSVPSANFFANTVTGPRTTFERPTYIDPGSRSARTVSNPQAQQPFRDNEEYGVMSEVNLNLGPATITYLGSYRESHRLEFSNISNGDFSSDYSGSFWQTSHELRLAVGGDGPLQAQVGGYYFKERSGVAFFINNLLEPNSRFGFPIEPAISENKSVFGQATYEVLPDLRLTGGLRYSHDRKSRVGNTVLDHYSSVVNSTNIGTFIRRDILQDNNASATFSKVTWRAGIDYDSSLGLIFASVSTGYKAGGFNDGCEIGKGASCGLPANALYYDPETLTSYEAGIKFKLTSDLRMNATIFHYDYKGLQLSQVVNLCGGPCQLTTNAAKAKVDGIELDMAFQATDKLALRGAVNYLHARYGSFEPQPGISLAGRSLNRSPKWTWSLGANYTTPMGAGDLVFDASIRGSSMYELTDLASLAYFYQPSYTKTDLSISYIWPDKAYSIGVYVENLENNLVLTDAAAGQFDNAAFADPRVFGVRAGVRF